MRKLYFLCLTLFSFLSFSGTLSAQTVTIGTGTSTQRWPLAYYWGFERSASIYKASEIGNTAAPVSVLSVAWFATAAANTGPTEIYVKPVGTTTTQLQTTWADKIADATLVYSGTPAVGAIGWRTVNLTTPFPLDQNQNLEVMVANNTGGTGTGTSTGNAVQYSVVTGNPFQYWTADDAPPLANGILTNNRPNIQLVLGPPIFCVTPPDGGTLTGPSSPVCPGTQFPLTITGGTFGTGVSYQWQVSSDNVSWTDIAGATLANLTTSQGGASYYRRKISCSGQDGFSNTVFAAITLPISTFPWSEDFDGVAAGSLPSCTSVQNVNGGPTWTNVGVSDLTTWGWSAPNALRYTYSSAIGGDDWFFTPAFDLVAGTTYRLRFRYGATDPLYPEALKVAYGSTPTATAMTNVVIDYPSINAPSAAPFAQNATLSITPTVSGSYHFGFQAHSSADQFYLYLDNIIFDKMPNCFPPTDLTVTNVATTAATISWTAATPAPGLGYVWEVRTSGDGGSGATGLAASGSTAAGVLTANVTGLTENTDYTLWVHSACSSTESSSWADVPATFHTFCNTINAASFTETFESDSPTRDCWQNESVSGSTAWTFGAGAGNGGSITDAHGGTVNAQLFGDGTGDVSRLVSPALDLSSFTATGADLNFWYANENWLGDQNELRVYYRSSNSDAWTLLPGAIYTSNVGSWTQVTIENLPGISNEYSLAFEGTEDFGFGVELDDISIAAAPSCRPVKDASAIGITNTAANVYFTSPGTDFIVEYGAPGFVPGTGATAGAGTIVTGAASPITITGLGSSTAYDFYIRRVCIAGSDYSTNVKVTATTLCPAVSIPYTQNFESASVPGGFPTCTSMQDVNGNSGPDVNATGGRWVSGTGTANNVYVSPTKYLRYIYDAADPSRAADDWFYTGGLNLTSGQTYRLKFYYKASDGPTYIEKLEVKYGTEAHAGAMTNALYSNMSIASALANPFDSAQVDFTPSATGVYYLGFHALSDPDQAFLYIDDISVKPAPTIDMGITALKLPDLTCASTTAVFPTAVMHNYNLTPIDFTAHPITVNAVVTGAANTTLTTTINQGSLAAGDSMEVYLNPSMTFGAGNYHIVTSTVSADDPEPGNNSVTRDVAVSPLPTAAVITPSAAAVCVGGIAKLNTQFVPITSSTTLPLVTSGALTLAIPDGGAGGVTHSLAVSGIPLSASIVSVSVTLNITHTYNSDLTINLRAPNGNVLNLVNGRGGSGDNFSNAVISSTGTTTLPNGNVTVTGTFRADGANGVGPTGAVSNVTTFDKLYSVANGNWTLALRDGFALDAGSLTSWSISITYQASNPKVTWTPVTGLFTDAAATVPYTANSDAYSVYAKPAATTTYTITSTNLAGCKTTASVPVTVSPFPVISIGSIPDTVCNSDQSIPLSATPAGGSWSGPGVSGNTLVPPAMGLGTFTLVYTYTSPAGCTTTATKSVAVKDCPERLLRLRDNNALVLFPNPNDGRFNVKINTTLYNTLGMRVYTNDGTLVRAQQFSGLVYGRVLPIDLTNLPGGLYLVKFYYDGATRYSDKTINVIIGH